MAKRPPTSPTDRLLQSLLVLSRAVEEVLELHGAGKLALGDGVTSNKLRALCYLDQQGAQPATRVAGFLKVTPGAVTQLADALEGAGMVERLREGKDRRLVSLSLTKKGRSFVRSVRQEQRQILQSAYRNKSATHVNQWTVVLDEISKALANSERSFEALCLQCGAYADGECILDGGNAVCMLKAKNGARTSRQEPQPLAKPTKHMSAAKVGSKAGRKTKR